MKPLPCLSAAGKSRRAVALVIVLCLIAIILALAIAFLSRTSVERASSASYAASATTRQLADLAVNLEQGLIRDATTQGIDVAWASQPGMVRTFDNSGNLSRAYKLYSSDKMILNYAGKGLPALSAADFTADSAITGSWASNRATWTDLNAPATANSKTIYPILDPGAQATVKGFSLAAATPVTATSAAPMPVKWLYVLQNGTIVAPTGSGNTAVVAGASAANAIVGRIAFWTDDETCKVNINTAAGLDWTTATNAAVGGAFYDVPRADSNFERSLAANQPLSDEFQRYPGHPATTVLGAVFPALTASQIYSLAPRIADGASILGTVDNRKNSKKMTLDSDRLYASIDELAFAQPAAAATSRTATAGLTSDDVQRAQFFLTARGNAPDLNLYNLPRISLWPQDSKPKNYDLLAAYTATIGGRAYYLQRTNADSSSADLPDNASASGVGRNRQLLEYLRTLTGRAVPGFGGSFANKYANKNLSNKGTERDQILTEIFDYIRCVNITDRRNDNNGASAPYSGSGQVVPIVDAKKDTRGFGRWRTVCQAGFIFVGEADRASGGPSGANPAPNTVASGMIRVRPYFVIEPFFASQGYPDLRSAMVSYRVTGLDALKWSHAAVTKTLGYTSPITTNEADTMVRAGYMSLAAGLSTSAGISFRGNSANTLDVTANGTFDFTGGNLTVEVLFPNSTNNGNGNGNGNGNTPTYDVIQTLTINLPSGTFPAPALAPTAVPAGATTWDWRDLTNRVTMPLSPFISAADTVRTVITKDYDHRLISARAVVPSSLFQKSPGYDTTTQRAAHSLYSGNDPWSNIATGAVFGSYVPGVTSLGGGNFAIGQETVASNDVAAFAVPVTPTGVTATTVTAASTVDKLGYLYAFHQIPGGQFAYLAGSSIPGDWDNGSGNYQDGPYINKADEGAIELNGQNVDMPYYGRGEQLTLKPNFYSANRQIPSALMMGSLSSGVLAQKPWQTLLFRPGPAGHPGLGSPAAGPPFTIPADYLLADLFQMPVVEPYSISEPFSTNGRINLNHQIMPFDYITRTTGIQAVLASERMLAIPNSEGYRYKTPGATNLAAQPAYRKTIDIGETLKGFDAVFSRRDIFRSATQICSLWLVPQGASYNSAGLESWWSNYALTGDNSRERPYATIYPRVTTKSNTFTVHYRVQSLKQSPRATVGSWSEVTDRVTGELRGSTTIERYITPNDDPTIPNYADDITLTPALDSFYKWRVVNTRQFAP